jgi:hypothetical protein
MRNWIVTVAVLLCACIGLVTTAHAQNASERMDNLTALYMVRASEPLCGFKMTDKQRSEVLKAAGYLEGKLELSSGKAEAIYNKIVQSMEAQKASGLCDPNGEWAHAFKQTVENFAQSGAAPSTPTPTSSAPAGSAKLTGLAAWKAVLGNTIGGQRDDEDYAEYYAPDGRIVSLDGGQIEIGSWSLRGDLVCTNFPSEDKVCYHIDVLGDTATFVDEDGNGFHGTILKGNPKNLK